MIRRRKSRIRSKKGFVYTYGELAREVQELLQLPAGRHFESSQSAKIVKLIMNTVVKGLLRDGRVHIQGFGTFSIRERREHMHNKMYFMNNRVTHMGLEKEPAKKYVHFKPSDGLKKFVSLPLREEEDGKEL